MPLGQAPFGTRTPSGEPPAPGGSRRFGDPRRWLLWLSLAAMLGWLASDVFGKRARPSGPVECLTDKVCASGERCYVVPKDDSGFASPGLCLKTCTAPAECAAPLVCGQVAVMGTHTEPLGSSTGASVTLCRLP